MEITHKSYDDKEEEVDIPLLPIKDIETRSYDKRGPWQVSDPENIIRNSLQDGELVIDYEHQSNYSTQNGLPAPAAGWIVDMFLDAKRQYIIAKVRWTKKALDMIKNKEYRYISPSFLLSDNQHITQIIGAGLVNQPAITQLPAITAKATNSGFVKSIGHVLRYGKTQAVYTHASALPPLQAEALDSTQEMQGHQWMKKAIKNGLITPAQQEIALRCFLKAGKDFYQFLESILPYPDIVQAKSMTPMESYSHSTEAKVIACLGIDPQLFSIIKAKEHLQ